MMMVAWVHVYVVRRAVLNVSCGELLWKMGKIHQGNEFVGDQLISAGKQEASLHGDMTSFSSWASLRFADVHAVLPCSH